MKFKHLYRTTPIPCILNNKPYTGTSRYNVYRTDTPEKKIFHEVSSCSVDDATKLADAAHSAFKDWRKSTPGDRKSILLKTSQIIKDHLQEHVAAVENETCVTGGFAQIDQMVLACSQLEQLARTIDHGLESTRLPDADGGVERYIHRDPYGVVLGIAPWNAPFYLGLRAVLYPIFSGNTAVLKTSEHSPQVQTMVAACLAEAGLPGNVLNVAHVAPEDTPKVTEALIAHPFVRKINFTGSTRVGAKIAETAGKYLKPTCMELGGRASMIVLADADLDLAAQHLVFGGFLNSNQICMAVNNVFVHDSVASELTHRVQTIFSQNSAILTAKYEPSSAGTHGLRSLFTKASGQRVKNLYDDAISKGATVLAGRPGFDGALVQPVVLGNMNSSMRLYNEETFGPLLSVVAFSDIASAVDECNASEYALSSCVFGRDLKAATAVARSLETSMVHVNASSVADDPAMLHGGWKQSGWGQLSGSWTEFTHPQCVTVQRGSGVPLGAL